MKLKDLDKVEPLKGGLMLPVGHHTVTIEYASEGTSSGGYDQIELRFFNDAGDIRDWLIFAPAKIEGAPSFAMQKARALLDAVGIKPKGGDWEFPTEDLAGKTLLIRVGEEPDNRGGTNEDGTPKMRRRVYEYLPVNGGNKLPGDVAPGDDIPF